MEIDDKFGGLVSVALRKESVDRNNDLKVPDSVSKESLSARRAWIEIPRPPRGIGQAIVALRKESVDRNMRHPTPISTTLSRSPQGERG